jgi:hypothetical protein
MCSLFINDLDAGAGRMGESTQYTVNNQMVNATLMNIADSPTNVQLPGVYKNEEIPRVPIICTGALVLVVAVAVAVAVCAFVRACVRVFAGFAAVLRCSAVLPCWGAVRRASWSTPTQQVGRQLQLCGPPAGGGARAPGLAAAAPTTPPPPPPPQTHKHALQATTSARCMRRSSATGAWRSTTGTPHARTASACAWASSRRTRWVTQKQQHTPVTRSRRLACMCVCVARGVRCGAERASARARPPLSGRAARVAARRVCGAPVC